MANYSARQVGGLIVTLVGLLILLSGLLVNPWMARLWKDTNYVDYHDVLLGYGISSAAIGLAILGLGIAVGRSRRRWLDRVTIVVIVLGGAFLCDRFLLTLVNVTMWRFDPEIHYVHREGTVRRLRPGAMVRINSLGFHDDEFPRQKPEGEFRGLMLGDSVTMGFRLTHEETFSHRLEELLTARGGPFKSYQIINAGVSGYSTYHEAVVLRRFLDLEPDFVVVGVCMNDMAEPFLADANFGGFGHDYHGVWQSKSSIVGYMSNETGLGRLLQSMSYRNELPEMAARAELFNIRKMAERPADDPEFKAGWDAVLGSLEDIYAVTAQNDIPVVLLLFPFRFQLLAEDLRRPQRILTDHARQHNVACMDLADAFRDLVFDDAALLAVMRNSYTLREIDAFHGWKFEKYFQDADHFTPQGHEVIADALYEYLLEAKILSPGKPR